MMTPEQRQRTEERMQRYRERYPEEAARSDALFAPLNDEMARLRNEVESWDGMIDCPTRGPKQCTIPKHGSCECDNALQESR